MARNLFATLSFGASVEVRRIPMDTLMQREVSEAFDTQERQLLMGVDDEILFDGGYFPEGDNEILYLDDLVEAAAMMLAVEGNSTAYQVLDDADLHSGNIRSLFSGERQSTGTFRIGVQNFQRTQVLQQGLSFLHSADTYHKLEENGLSLANSVACIVEGRRTKFTNFSRAKRIFDLREVYREATTPEVEEFCSHAALLVSDTDSFVQSADQSMRKTINQIRKSAVLNRYPTEAIKAAADEIGFPLEMDENRIVIPPDKGKAKLVLNFLDDGVYRSHLTDQLYYANSKRTV